MQVRHGVLIRSVIGLPIRGLPFAAHAAAGTAGFDAFVVEDVSRPIDLNGSLAVARNEMAAKGVQRIRSSDLDLA